MVAAFTSVLILFAYGTVAIGSWVGAKRVQQKRLRFSHLVSAWWVVILTAFAVIPPMAVDQVMKRWPNPDEARWIPFEPYLTGVTLPFVGLAGVSVLVQAVRLGGACLKRLRN